MQGVKRYYLILYTVMKYGTTKKTFSDVLIKQADTKAKEFKTIMSPINCFDTEV